MAIAGLADHHVVDYEPVGQSDRGEASQRVFCGGLETRSTLNCDALGFRPFVPRHRSWQPPNRRV
jgi:hypothetical protein